MSPDLAVLLAADRDADEVSEHFRQDFKMSYSFIFVYIERTRKRPDAAWRFDFERGVFEFEFLKMKTAMA